MAEVGNHQKARCSGRDSRARVGDELVDRVEGKELNSRTTEDLVAAELGGSLTSVGVDSWGVDYGFIDATGSSTSAPFASMKP